ncbi:hypothetical protein [Nocardia abscessus]|uniref:hypothetical protein n=1 Tax=Nocardia abscessus TaxID=120957 RepID=UPI002454829B|nr:hypothetical protein [Nocardia abscessus]
MRIDCEKEERFQSSVAGFVAATELHAWIEAGVERCRPTDQHDNPACTIAEPTAPLQAPVGT